MAKTTHTAEKSVLRNRVLTALKAAGRDGLTVTEIGKALDLPARTLDKPLSRLFKEHEIERPEKAHYRLPSAEGATKQPQIAPVETKPKVVRPPGPTCAALILKKLNESGIDGLLREAFNDLPFGEQTVSGYICNLKKDGKIAGFKINGAAFRYFATKRYLDEHLARTGKSSPPKPVEQAAPVDTQGQQLVAEMERFSLMHASDQTLLDVFLDRRLIMVVDDVYIRAEAASRPNIVAEILSKASDEQLLEIVRGRPMLASTIAQQVVSGAVVRLSAPPLEDFRPGSSSAPRQPMPMALASSVMPAIEILIAGANEKDIGALRKFMREKFELIARGGHHQVVLTAWNGTTVELTTDYVVLLGNGAVKHRLITACQAIKHKYITLHQKELRFHPARSVHEVVELLDAFLKKRFFAITGLNSKPYTGS